MNCRVSHLKMVDPLYGLSGQPCSNFVLHSYASIWDLSLDRNKQRSENLKTTLYIDVSNVICERSK